MIKVLSYYIKNQLNAGPKAKYDVEDILVQQFGAKKICIEEKKGKKNKIIAYVKIIITMLMIKKDDIVIVQFPFPRKIIKFFKKLNIIIFIHDINGLRYKDSKLIKKEIDAFQSSEAVIVHNDKMKKFLIDQGVNSNKLYVLELFDYITAKQKQNNIKSDKIKICYTGNMDKANFIHQLEEEKMNFNLYVYGVKNKEIKNKRIEYKGKFLPDELPYKIEENIGLVWDGNVDENDENEGFKNYTKYNNPHKLSCYLAANIPVIVWEKAAIADLVKKYNIGYFIRNIYDINKIDFSDYNEKIKNIKELSRKVRNGYFTNRVVNEIIKDISGDETK